MSRDHPALEVRWPAHPDPEIVECLLADVDEAMPTAIEELTDGIRLFFAEPSHRDRAAALVADAHPALTCGVVTVNDEDWAARSQSALGAVQVGSLVVAPPWAREAAERDRDDRIVIVIQPSMGFGTGHHASTRLVLALLQRMTLAGRAMLDVGTGSGVLAIAGWKCGARPVTGIDYDDDALTSARENLALNDAEAIQLERVDLATAHDLDAFDVVTANLTGAMIQRHAPRLARWLTPGGTLLASGFQADEEMQVSAGLARAGLAVVHRAEEEGWVAVEAVRAAAPAIL
ncbi:MAG: 50S ribosomal protein L11 methyltransferase [Acidobacteria bacterium]|nr:50S ribosomal protein L11 methyltransferase [Acidobacteriota bacterium]